MRRFEYEIASYPAERFAQLVYFCSDEGDCSLEQVPSSQMEVFQSLLNERGGEGWELVQGFFGSNGVLVIWKRET